MRTIIRQHPHHSTILSLIFCFGIVVVVREMSDCWHLSVCECNGIVGAKCFEHEYFYAAREPLHIYNKIINCLLQPVLLHRFDTT